VEDIQAEDTQAEPEPDVVEPAPDVINADEGGPQDVLKDVIEDTTKDVQAEAYVPEANNGGGGGGCAMNNVPEGAANSTWFKVMWLMAGLGVATRLWRRRHAPEKVKK
ncbi:MAG: hypothetical protein ABH856_04030, partial [Patescibacteria group bacterium]